MDLNRLYTNKLLNWASCVVKLGNNTPLPYLEMDHSSPVEYSVRVIHNTGCLFGTYITLLLNHYSNMHCIQPKHNYNEPMNH